MLGGLAAKSVALVPMCPFINASKYPVSTAAPCHLRPSTDRNQKKSTSEIIISRSNLQVPPTSRYPSDSSNVHRLRPLLHSSLNPSKVRSLLLELAGRNAVHLSSLLLLNRAFLTHGYSFKFPLHSLKTPFEFPSNFLQIPFTLDTTQIKTEPPTSPSPQYQTP